MAAKVIGVRREGIEKVRSSRNNIYLATCHRHFGCTVVGQIARKMRSVTPSFLKTCLVSLYCINRRQVEHDSPLRNAYCLTAVVFLTLRI